MRQKQRLNIGLIGYGRMGQEIEQAAVARKHRIAAVYEIDTPLTGVTIEPDIDILIDFSIPEAVYGNIKAAARAKKPIVIGTTGWTDRMQDARNIITESKSAALFATNFSLGVNLFFRIVKYAAEQMDPFDEYDAFIHEMHHRAKLDSPSGTALHLGDIVCSELTRKDKLKTSRSDGGINQTELHISSTRCGKVPGTHIVGFESEGDSIELKHTARNRKGYAAGAIYAAEWLTGKTGFYGIDDFIDSIMLGGDPIE